MVKCRKLKILPLLDINHKLFEISIMVQSYVDIKWEGAQGITFCEGVVLALEGFLTNRLVYFQFHWPKGLRGEATIFSFVL